MDKQKDPGRKKEEIDEEKHNSSSSSSDQSEIEESHMEQIRKYLSQKLHLSSESSDEDQKEKILSERSLEGIVDYIQKNNITKVITMAGAGISTSAGIPDFRSPSSGLYHNLEKYNLPHPQAIFEIDFFKENPEPFFILAKKLLPEGFRPTISHYFIRLLLEKGMLLRHYTQNIDTLERVAGLPEEKLVEAHGTFHTGRCLQCRCPYDFEWMKRNLQDKTILKCENVKCHEGIVKPDIVFFGEMLPERFHTLVDKDFHQAELLIIMGSSLVVQPFASLTEKVKSGCPRVLINKEKVGMQDRFSRFFGRKSGLRFDSDSNRDVALLGECDQQCQLLAEKLGWGDELKTLMENEYKRLDAEASRKS